MNATTETSNALVTPNTLANFHSAVAGIHAQFANTLAQAGNDVSETNSASELLNVAAAVSNTIGKPPGTEAAPNYADFALHAFMMSMQSAAIAFAAAHLPDKFKPVIGQLNATVQAALTGVPANSSAASDTAASEPVEVVDATLNVAAAAVDIAHPEAAPIVAIAEPVIEDVVNGALGHEAQAAATEPLTATPITQPPTASVEPATDPQPEPVLVSKADLLADDAQH